MNTPLSQGSPQLPNLRWVENAAAPRSTRIMYSTWEQYRAKISELYQQMPLDELMEIMQKEHNFTPTRRQYVYQLQKWKVSKYKTEKTNQNQHVHASLEGDSSGTCSTTSPEFASFFAPRHPPPLEIEERAKRHRSFQSARSSVSTSSITRPPPTKKLRHDLESLASGTSVELEDSLDTLSENYSTPTSAENASEMDQTVASPNSSPSSSYAETRDQVLLADAHDAEHLSFSDNEDSASLIIASNSIDSLNPSKEGNSSKPSTPHHQLAQNRVNFSNEVQLDLGDTTGPHKLSIHWNSVEELSQLCKTMATERPLSSWSPADTSQAVLAGEYWEALGRKEQSFSLYTLLLLRLHDAPTQPSSTFRNAVINYSRCISTPAHCEIVQHHLRAQEDQLKNDPSATFLDRFMICMAFAETCSRMCDVNGAELYLLQAQDHIKHFDRVADVFQYLPDDCASSDLLLCLYLRRACDPREDLLPGANSADAFALWKNRGIELELSILNKAPGPFELGSGLMMRNPCVMSCLEWCRQTLPAAKLGDQVTGKSRAFFEEISKVAPHLHRECLFKGLWEVWRQEESNSRSNFFLDLWKLEARSRTGLSPTEILAITCVQIDMARKPNDKVDSSPCQVALSASSAITKLLTCSHLQLARRFLAAFVQYRSIADDRISRARDVAPQSRPSKSTDRLGLSATGMSTNLTLASSLRSSNKSLINFRKVQESAMERIGQFKKRPSSLSSFSQSQCGSKGSASRWSFWSISQLSEDIERIGL